MKLNKPEEMLIFPTLLVNSTVLQAFRFPYETLAEVSYGDTTAYTGRLHSLLCTIYIAKTEPHLKLH